MDAFAKHKRGKDGRASRCKECRREHYRNNREQVLERQKTYREENREKVLERQKTYREENREKVAEYLKEYRKANKEKIAEYQRAVYVANKEKIAEKKKIYREANKEKIAEKSKIYREANKERTYARNANRRAARLQRTPAWLTKADRNRIVELYKLAKQLEKQTGEKYHVDHIIPLQGVNVSGFHHPDNLQVLPASENLSKNNSYIPVPTIDYVNT